MWLVIQTQVVKTVCQLSPTGISRLSVHESGTIYRPMYTRTKISHENDVCRVVVHIPTATENPSLFEVISRIFHGH